MKYNGKLQNAGQAKRWVKMLIENGHGDAATLLQRDWHSIAARPELAEKIYNMTKRHE